MKLGRRCPPPRKHPRGCSAERRSARAFGLGAPAPRPSVVTVLARIDRLKIEGSWLPRAVLSE